MVNLAHADWEHLEAYCTLTGKDCSEVLRDCVRKLKLPKANKDA